MTKEQNIDTVRLLEFTLAEVTKEGSNEPGK
jgi:hypothetical protein